jgi:hypothetical protein
MGGVRRPADLHALHIIKMNMNVFEDGEVVPDDLRI